MPQRTPRVFIGLTEVAGVYTSLQQGLEELGISTMRVDVAGNPRGYRAASASAVTGAGSSTGVRWSEAGSWIERACASVASLLSQTAWPTRLVLFPVHVLTQATRAVYRLGLLCRVAWSYDVIVLTGGASFFRGRDLPLLKRLGKRTIVVFTGSDHRPPYLNGKLYRAMSTEALLAEARRIRRFLEAAERNASAIVALSSSAQFHRRPFVHLLALGIPFSPSNDDLRPGAPVFVGHGVRILHGPTDPISKGTDEIRAIIKDLRSEGLPVDYVEIIDRPHSEVIAALKECDFVVDELHSDTPLARLATEAGYFGKSAITGGAYATEIEDDIPANMIPPSTFVPPDQVPSEVRRFATDAAYRSRKGNEVGAFIRVEWAPKAVARRFLRIVDGTMPSEWTYEPSRLRYVAGWGLRPTEWRESIEAIFASAEQGDLGLSPGLVARIQSILADGRPSGDVAPREVGAAK